MMRKGVGHSSKRKCGGTWGYDQALRNRKEAGWLSEGRDEIQDDIMEQKSMTMKTSSSYGQCQMC